MFNWTIADVLEPVRSAFTGMSAIATFTLAMGLGYIIGGFRSALIVGAYPVFIALTALWDRTLTTAYSYFIAIALVFAGTLGTLLGILYAMTPTLRATIEGQLNLGFLSDAKGIGKSLVHET